MKKRLLTILLALAVAVSALSMGAFAAESTRFSDVSDQDTALAIESLRLMGALDGYPDGTFRPEGNLTRAQFCKIAVYAMNGENELGLYQTITVFPDVKSSHWAAPYVNMAAKGKGIIAGYPDGSFHPEETVTAGQAVTILLRLLDYKDADIGGVWPQSYMALAEKIGLMEGVDTTGTAPLTRGQAARLFLNLLQSEKKDGGSYVASVGGSVISDAVLVSSAATGSDGRPTAMELSGGEVYTMAYKASSGILNGHRGDLVLNQQGKVLTFVPTDVGSGKTVTMASASATRITDTAGAKYTVSREAVGYYNGQQKSWSEIYAWLNAGTEVTLYTGSTGAVEYVFAAGTAVETAIVVEENGSAKGFDALAGNTAYTIYKNGARATVSDLRKGDVATYSASTNSIRVCDTRVSVYYEDCSPSPKEPMEITVLGGVKLNVLTSAMESVDDFKPGSKMTLLLTDDGQVAGAVSGSSANAVGFVSGGEVQLLCGSSRISLGAVSGAEEYEGMVVTISSDKKGVKASKAAGDLTGALDVAAKKLGDRDLAENVMILENGRTVALADLTSSVIPKSQIGYARKNWAGEVDLIQIGDSKGGTVYYGRAQVETHIEYDIFGGTEVTMLNVQYAKDGALASTGAYETGYAVSDGNYVAATLRGDRFVRVTVLDAVKNVPNSAWTSPTAVTVKGKLYTVPEDVLCYNRSTGRWMTLSEGHAYAEECTLYVQDDIVRVVEIKN